MFRRSRFALAEAVEAAVPVAASGSVLLEASMSWTIVPFLLSEVTAIMVPLLAVPSATEPEEPVERGVVDDEVALVEASLVAAARVELLVGLGLTVTVVIVVFEKYTVEVARAAASVMVALFFDAVEAGAVPSGAVERVAPVACATPDTVVLFENSATVALACEVLEV